MKKLIITAACVAVAVSGFAQGTVQFVNGAGTAIKIANYNGTGVDAASNNVTSGTIASMNTGASAPYGTSTGVIDVGLWWSASTFNTIGGGTFAGMEQISSTSAGQLLNGNASFAITGAAAGATVFMQCFEWDNSYGDTAAGAAACLAAGGFFGAPTAGIANTTYGDIGTAITVVLGQPSPAAGTPIFNATAGSFNKSVLLAQTPEPATIALGGLGAAALLLFRRRK